MYQKPFALPSTGYAGAGGLTLLTAAHHTLAALVLLFAAMTLYTIGAELRHRLTKEGA